MEIDQIKSVNSYTATIYCGLRSGYSTIHHDWDGRYLIAKKVCQEYCDDVGLCVTIKKVDYIYKDGNEPGIEVGLINYPRFEETSSRIDYHAKILANELMLKFNQHRVSIVTPDKTYMIKNKIEA
jgi:hypothetical protein